MGIRGEKRMTKMMRRRRSGRKERQRNETTERRGRKEGRIYRKGMRIREERRG